MTNINSKTIAEFTTKRITDHLIESQFKANIGYQEFKEIMLRHIEEAINFGSGCMYGEIRKCDNPYCKLMSHRFLIVCDKHYDEVRYAKED